MRFIKHRLKFRIHHLIVFCFFLFMAAIAFTITRTSHNPALPEQEVKSEDVQVIGPESSQRVILSPSEHQKVIESKVIKANFQFNAIAPHWKEKNAAEDNRKVELRTSMDGKEWTSWMEIEAVGPLRNDDPHPDRMYAETPLFVDGQYFQTRVTLNRDSLQEPVPEIYDLKINHIDSRKSARAGMSEKPRGLFKSNKAYAAQSNPRIISRSEWGSPDPYGGMFKGTEKDWPVTYAPVRQVFIHHTATPSYQSDPSAAVRAIWDFHANTRGWGDIGYNYLIDHQGNVYQGRLGGDNVVAGHVYKYNKGSLGVALLGCFETSSQTCNELNNGNTVSPSTTVLNSLSSLLGNKTASFEINPNTTQTFCDTNGQNCLNLWTITGHRDANSTSCPGDLTVNSLQNIRNETLAKKNEGWYYSAKQESYDAVDLSAANSVNVTVRFKNTGTTAWSNTANKVSLYTMEPPGRTSVFQGTGWPSSARPALLNEAQVDPGQIGSFTFNVNRPDVDVGEYAEGVTLITDDGNTPGTFYTVPIKLYCTIGQASNPRANGVLIHDVSNGSVHLLENGSKRWVKSHAAMVTNGYDYEKLVNVSGAESALYGVGKDIKIREGTLVSSPSSNKVYIIDETADGYVRRWVTNPATMEAFGLRWNVNFISDEELAGYPDGVPLYENSAIPDGLLVNEDSTGRVYLIQDAARRWVESGYSLKSNAYSFSDVILSINESKLDQLNEAVILKMRIGSLITSVSTDRVYSIDYVNGVASRRWVTNGKGFIATGYRWNAINWISEAELNGYADGSNIECHL